MSRTIEMNLEFILDLITCPITHSTYIIPVIASDSYTYERSAIILWNSTNVTSPLTRKTLKDEYYKNRKMKALIDKFVDRYPKYNEIIFNCKTNIKIEMNIDFMLELIQCPITKCIYENPVVASDSETYELDAIKKKKHTKNIEEFYTDIKMKQLISEFLMKYPQYKEDVYNVHPFKKFEININGTILYNSVEIMKLKIDDFKLIVEYLIKKNTLNNIIFYSKLNETTHTLVKNTYMSSSEFTLDKYNDTIYIRNTLLHSVCDAITDFTYIYNKCSMKKTYKENRIEQLKYLLDIKDINLHVLNSIYYTPLQIAIYNNNLDIAMLLIEKEEEYIFPVDCLINNTVISCSNIGTTYNDIVRFCIETCINNKFNEHTDMYKLQDFIKKVLDKFTIIPQYILGSYICYLLPYIQQYEITGYKFTIDILTDIVNNILFRITDVNIKPSIKILNNEYPYLIHHIISYSNRPLLEYILKKQVDMYVEYNSQSLIQFTLDKCKSKSSIINIIICKYDNIDNYLDKHLLIYALENNSNSILLDNILKRCQASTIGKITEQIKNQNK